MDFGGQSGSLHTPERGLDGSGLGVGSPRHNQSFMLATDGVHVTEWVTPGRVHLTALPCPPGCLAVWNWIPPPSAVLSSVGRFRSHERALAAHYGFSSSERIDEDFFYG